MKDWKPDDFSVGYFPPYDKYYICHNKGGLYVRWPGGEPSYSVLYFEEEKTANKILREFKKINKKSRKNEKYK